MGMKANDRREAVALGAHIVVDPKVCHGKPTFKGTRVMVFQVLEQVACGTPWERIVWSWRGKVPMEAISEAVKLASRLFQEEEVFQAHGLPGHSRTRGGNRHGDPAVYEAPGFPHARAAHGQGGAPPPRRDTLLGPGGDVSACGSLG